MKGTQTLNFMGSSNNRLLVHRNMDSVTLNETIDVVISPQFYTFLREELAINFTYKAKQIAPSLFDDYIDEADEHQYHVYKCGEAWCFYAYTIEEITSFLKHKGIEPHQVGKIYFAQELNASLNQAIKLSEYDSMQSIEGVVTVIPNRLMSGEEKYQNLDLNKPLLQHGLAISSSLGSVVPVKQTIMLTLLLTVLGVSFIIEGNRTRGATLTTQEKFNALMDQNPKLGSSLIRNSESKKYTPIDQQERLKRDSVTALSKMLSAQSQLRTLTMDEKSLTATLRTHNKATAQAIEKEAKQTHFTVKSLADKEVILEKKL